MLPRKHPRHVLYRSPEPVLTPELPQERIGTVANVVFPTAIDRRDDLGLPDRFDVYYGMADNRIGVARLDVPEFLPQAGLVDPSRADEFLPFDGQSHTDGRRGAATANGRDPSPLCQSRPRDDGMGSSVKAEQGRMACIASKIESLK